MDRVKHSPDGATAPVLVLGVGNVLLGDDGVGPRLVRELQALYSGVPAVECLDGGTQGLALLAYFDRRQSLIIVDAVSGGGCPGEVSVFDRAALLASNGTRATTAHEGNASELLACAHLLDELPERVFLVGVQPERIQTELALSESVAKALPEAFTRACQVIEQELALVTNLTAA